RRGLVAAALQHHTAAVVAVDVLRDRAVAHQRLPGVRPGLRDDGRWTQQLDAGGGAAGLRPDLPLWTGRYGIGTFLAALRRHSHRDPRAVLRTAPVGEL